MVDVEMTAGQKLMERAGMIMQERGCPAVELAKRSVLAEQVDHERLREALFDFIDGWNDVLHPALTWLACEAVGGKPETTTKAGAALVLLAGGADIHDDVIDESVLKGSEQTIFGKYGKDIAILAGDALLLKGAYLLHEACEELEKSKKKAVLEIVKRAFFEISGGEAAETSMRGRTDVPKQKYLEIIRSKVAAGEASARIGAIMGEGTSNEVEMLAEYGRVYGILLTIRDEFVDMFEQDELQNRVEREVLPLPLIVTFEDENKKFELLRLLQGEITPEKNERILDIVIGSPQSALLVSEMRQMVDQIILKTKALRYGRESLELMVRATLEDL